MNHHTRLWVAAGIIAAVVLGGFVLSVPRATEVKQAAKPADEAPAPAVTLHDSYKKGVHTITGSVTAPNACTQVTAEASVSGGTTTPAITVAVAMPKSDGVCLELPTDVPFKLTVTAPAHAAITATVNGQTASTTP